MADERTEQPTPKRLEEARKKGQVVRSRDLHDVLQLSAVVLAFGWVGSAYVEGLMEALTIGLTSMGAEAKTPVGARQLENLALSMAGTLVALVGPLAGAAVIGGLGAGLVQGGFSGSAHGLKFDLARLSPMRGLQRLAPSKAGIDVLRAILLCVVLTWIAWQAIAGIVLDAPLLGRVAPADAARLGWRAADGFLRKTLVAFFVVAGADYLWQWWRHRKGLMMTRQEVKDEAKLTDGNPEIKARVRRVQREMARRRMLAAVPQATVVITNPTHVAVALEYHRHSMTAPRVVAKGPDLLAARIRDVARAHSVPIVENPPLARALFANAEVGDAIPGDLFEAVAEVLAYLIRLKQLAL